jgi:hypothetical protein
MKTSLHPGVVLAFCACVTGCAGPRVAPGMSATTALATTRTVSAADAGKAVAVGNSTKAEVTAALGKTTAVRFDSGYEVWVYQVRNESSAAEGLVERLKQVGSKQAAPGNSEFVVLFNPAGIVTKTRVRNAPSRSAAKD